MNKEQLEQILRDISETKDPEILENIASVMQRKTDKLRRQRIKEHKEEGLTPLESLQEFKKEIAWAGSKAMDFAAEESGEGSNLDEYIEQEARETFRRARRDIEEIYGVTLKKKEKKR